MKNFLLTLVTYLLFLNYIVSQEIIIKREEAKPETVLFIGNSYLYYGDSLHNHFKRMVEEYFFNYSGSSVKSATIGGSRLKHHDVERLIMPQAISAIKKFDLVILQGGSSETLSESSRKEFSYYAKKHIDAIKANKSVAALYMTHSYVKPHKDFMEDQIKLIDETYTKVGYENQVLVIPVGLAFDLAYKKNPNIKLHKEDGTHPNLLGTYLAACTVFASVYGKSTIGMKYDYFGVINQKDKLFLQNIADQTTSNYLNRVLEY
tara:strand:- start:408 stop:1193 length:786 start_codon:yes stop_codon:yes gene_type:complete